MIDLSSMPSTGLSKDKKTITVSPARKWDDLYEELEPHNMTVVGGRVAGVGVGGLVTGCKFIEATVCDAADSGRRNLLSQRAIWFCMQ